MNSRSGFIDAAHVLAISIADSGIDPFRPAASDLRD
jgi:hypothetical protein